MEMQSVLIIASRCNVVINFLRSGYHILATMMEAKNGENPVRELQDINVLLYRLGFPLCKTSRKGDNKGNAGGGMMICWKIINQFNKTKPSCKFT